MKDKIEDKEFVSGGEKDNREVASITTPHQLQGKIESLGVLTEDKMFLKYSSDGILDLVNLIKQERKDAVEEFVNTIRLNGCSVADKYDAPKRSISLFVVLDQIEKLSEEYLTQQSLDKGEDE